MKKILLVCSGGVSTSILVNKMKEAARINEVKVKIEAVARLHSVEKAKDFDVVLLGPQIKVYKDKISKSLEGVVPVDVIDMKLYGRMNGEAVLNQAIDIIERGTSK